MIGSINKIRNKVDLVIVMMHLFLYNPHLYVKISSLITRVSSLSEGCELAYKYISFVILHHSVSCVLESVDSLARTDAGVAQLVQQPELMK